MSTPTANSNLPTVSVIVPARNEEACIGACLQSLVTQVGVGFETIVVDDGSSDRTREIALSFPLVRVVDAGPLPQGWTGKNNAMATGVQEARGAWLLFTDADTVHAPGSLVRSMWEARRRGVALMSYSPQQQVIEIWEKAIMPVIFAELATTYSMAKVGDPASQAAAANGQYLLISREAYEAVGGHAAIAGSLLEDVALARAVKMSGRRIFFRYGGDAVRTRMYRSLSQLREGWTKNLALLFAAPVRLAVWRLAEFVTMGATAEAAVLLALYGRTRLAVLSGSVFFILCAQFVRRIRRAHFASGATAWAYLGLPVFSYLLLRSNHFYRKGNVTWKGRGYDPRAEIQGQRLKKAKREAAAGASEKLSTASK